MRDSYNSCSAIYIPYSLLCHLDSSVNLGGNYVPPPTPHPSHGSENDLNTRILHYTNLLCTAAFPKGTNERFLHRHLSINQFFLLFFARFVLRFSLAIDQISPVYVYVYVRASRRSLHILKIGSKHSRLLP